MVTLIVMQQKRARILEETKRVKEEHIRFIDSLRAKESEFYERQQAKYDTMIDQMLERTEKIEWDKADQQEYDRRFNTKYQIN